MSQPIDVSIILPAFDEERVIDHTLQSLADFIRDHQAELGRCEVIVVAAGSDRTAKLAGNYRQHFAAMQIITPNGRVGKGRDVRLGFQTARGAVQVFMDADLATPLHHLLPMVKALQEGKADVVIGTRRLSQIHAGRLRAMLSVASNLLIQTVLLPRFHDTQCGFKGFTAAAAKRLFASQSVQGWGFDLEVLHAAKRQHLRIMQLPVPDWHEARDEDLRGERLGSAALTTLRDLSLIRLRAWQQQLSHRPQWWITGAMVAVFGGSMWLGSSQSVWFDEAYSIMLIKQPWSQLIHLTSVDVHPPLYYMALKLWSMIFGMSEPALRSFSALCGAAAIGLALALIRRTFGMRALILSTPFLLLAPYLLRYNYELRMYALASLIGIAATYVLVRATQATSNLSKSYLWWAAYSLLVALGMYTLYYTALIWLAHGVWLLYLWYTQKPRRFLLREPWLAAFAGSAILYLPWLHTFLDQYNHQALSGVSQSTSWKTLVDVSSFMFTFKPQWSLHWPMLLALALGVIAAVYLIVQAWRYAASSRKYMVLLGLYAILPVSILLIASLPQFKPMFLMRYISPFIIGSYLLIAISAALSLQKRVRGALLGSLILLGLFGYGAINVHHTGNFTFEQLKRPQARYIAAKIAPCQPDSMVLAEGPMLFFELDYYLPDCNLRFIKNSPVSARGGFAILHDSPKQYFRGDPITSSTVYYVYTSKREPMRLPAAYKQVSQVTYQKFHLVQYKRS
jgi:mannosyltransferase